MPYALFKDGKQISKWHDTRLAVVVEAYEVGAVVSISSDFGPYQVHNQLADGYEIEEGVEK